MSRQKAILSMRSATLMVLSWCIPFLLHSQKLTFKHLTTEEGLSQNTVKAISQDSLGFIWFGTMNGLSRYNGYDFEIFEAQQQDSSSLPSSSINSIETDGGSKIWIGTNRGLCLWDQEKRHFERMGPYFEGDSLNAQYDIGDLLIDKEGGVWVMGELKGFHLFYKKKNETVFHKQLTLTNPPGINEGFYGQVMEDKSGNIWMGTSRCGLWMYRKKEKSFSKISMTHGIDLAITSLIQDEQGKVWIGTLNGLFAWDENSSEFEKISGLNDSMIRCLYLDRHNRIWVGTDKGGLHLFHADTKTFSIYDQDTDNSQSLLHNSIQSIFLDKQDILWVGTYAGGVNYYDPKSGHFQLYQSGNGNKSPNNNTITGFAEDHGNLWIATDRGGLNFFDRKNQTFHYWRHDKQSRFSISSDIIQHVKETSKGELWIATWIDGLDYFEKKTQRFYHYKHDPKNPLSILSNSINYIFEDSKTNLWVATTAGISFIDHRQLNTGMAPVLSFENLKSNTDPASISDSYIKTFYEDKQGALWVGTWEGLNRWNPETKTFDNYRHNPDHLNLFTRDYILSIVQDNLGNFLLGTNQNGLLYFEIKNNRLTTFNKQNGFPANTIAGIECDTKGFCWLSTNNGLIRFNSKDQSFVHYSQYDGLPSNEFRSNAYLRLRTGELAFGGNNGFTIFHPDSIPRNTVAPDVSLTRFKLFNKVITSSNSSLLKKDIALTRQIELDYDQSFIGIDFIGINFTSPQKNSFAYRLLGVDKTWNEVGNQRSASYSYLSPGTYQFSVKAANSDGVWSEPVSLSIVIHPPWWNTLIFKVSLLCAGILSLWLIVKLRTMQLYQRKRALEHTVAERTIELEIKNRLLSDTQEKLLHQKEEIKSQCDDLEQQFHTIQTLSDLGQKITAYLKKEELIIRIHHMINKLMEAPHLSIGHLSLEKNHIAFSTIREIGSVIEENTVSLQNNDRLSVLCIRSKQLLLFNDLANEIDNYLPSPSTKYRLKGSPQSAIYLPLLSMDGEVTGLLVAKNFQQNGFTALHVSLLKGLAAYIGIAFDNASVYKEIEAQSQLLETQSSKLKELDELKTRFFINMSHEFRTPLTLIISPLEQMLSQDENVKWPQVRHQLEVMNKNAKQLLGLINELLELRNIRSRADKMKISQYALIPFIKEVMIQFQDLADRHAIHFQLVAPDPTIRLFFDQEMMEKILVNIFSNAFKYTPFGGKILISVKIESEAEEKSLFIRIADTGKGILQKDLPYIFERFYQGEEPVHTIQQGSGLGLSLVKDLVGFHSGKVQVTSEPGKGTCVDLFFPYEGHMSVENTIAVSRNEISEEQEEIRLLSEKQPILLLVEDNQDVLNFLKTSLETTFTILTALEGQTGFDIATRHIPDLIVSDVMMPVMDGIQLCKKIKSDSRTSHIPLILLTARSGEASQIQGLEIGADDYIAKPFNVKILLARINNIIRTRKKLHELFSSQKNIDLNEIISNDQDKIFLEKLNLIIKQNAKNPELNHELLVKEIGMSKTQLYRKLHALTGTTVHEYIRNYRLRKAYEIIKQNPQLLIYEVAYEMGFKDHAYFSKSFHSFFSIWPKELKREFMNQG